MAVPVIGIRWLSLWVLVAFYVSSISTQFPLQIVSCPDGPCKCENNMILCMCNENGERENVSINTMMPSSVTSLEIHHCDVVEIEYGAFKFFKLDSLILNDLNTLILKVFSFLQVPLIEHVHISNIANFQPAVNSFFSIHNITELFMTNVTADILHTGFMLVTYVDILMLDGMNVNKIDNRAIYFNETNHFSISNSTFGTLYAEAISVAVEAKSVYIINNVVSLAERAAFNIPRISSYMIIRNCSFENTHASFVTANGSQHIAFERNRLGYCEANSFDALIVNGRFSFVDNVFVEAKEDCLPPRLNKSSQVNIEGNEFVCDCDFAWFYASEYRDVFGTSTCTVAVNNTHDTRVNVNDVRPIYNGNNCVGFTSVSATSVDVAQAPKVGGKRPDVLPSAGSLLTVGTVGYALRQTISIIIALTLLN